MKKIEQDTEKQLEILRCLKPKDKLRAAFELYEFARVRITAALRQQYPNLNAEELKGKVRERFMP